MSWENKVVKLPCFIFFSLIHQNSPEWYCHWNWAYNSFPEELGTTFPFLLNPSVPWKHTFVCKVLAAWACLVAALLKTERMVLQSNTFVSWHFIWCHVGNMMAFWFCPSPSPRTGGFSWHMKHDKPKNTTTIEMWKSNLLLILLCIYIEWIGKPRQAAFCHTTKEKMVRTSTWSQLSSFSSEPIQIQVSADGARKCYFPQHVFYHY